MNRLNRVAISLRNKFQSVRNSSDHPPAKTKQYDNHHSLKENDPTRTLYQKYWDDGLPAFPERAIYRNNYFDGGWDRPAKQRFMAELVGASLWLWIFWHVTHDFGHIIGHYEPPDPSQWTDAELGIPPDDVE